ncbi:hypothetical protein MAR_014713 [Mya arenaria]|uniref:Uncharacterized protein n=1 Tax=Mya arenaria TaxID=6604 RepID=A0ABY7FHU8_MYAAR|nr:hypothetical protein MAR_014713 [Mya arenaria]
MGQLVVLQGMVSNEDVNPATLHQRGAGSTFQVFTMENRTVSVRREVIRSQLEHLTRRLAENGEECFVVTATNPNILGSDKGMLIYQK